MSASVAILFPGQGAQAVGMGKDLAAQFPAASAVFQEADAILGFALSEICFSGPEERLNATDISQPAIYVTSVAAWAALKSTPRYADLKPAAAAGLSLGEYTALHLAGVFDFATGLKIVRERGLAMQAAAEAQPGGMVAVMGLDEKQVEELCQKAAEGEVLSPANFNAPGQVVISGTKAACQRALAVCEAMGGKPTPLMVVGAFHSPLMKPAVERLRVVLNQSPMQNPQFSVISNVTGLPHGEISNIRELLCIQCAQPIRWGASMQYLLQEKMDQFYEVGPGRVLSGLMRRIDRKTRVVNISDAGSLIG
jgi:[acyl-carrier-protein] S-malonyltransferase